MITLIDRQLHRRHQGAKLSNLYLNFRRAYLFFVYIFPTILHVLMQFCHIFGGDNQLPNSSSPPFSPHSGQDWKFNNTQGPGQAIICRYNENLGRNFNRVVESRPGPSLQQNPDIKMIKNLGRTGLFVARAGL